MRGLGDAWAWALGALVFLGASAWSSPAWAAWSPAERAQARQGAFPTHDLPAASGATVEALAFAGAAPAKALAVLWDHERFPEFMPNAKTARILERRSATWHILEQVGGQGPISVRVVTDRHRLSDGVRWKTIEGDVKANEGFWKLEAAPGGTWLTYHVHVEPKQPVPDTVTAFLQRRALPGMLASVVQRITKVP